MYFTERYIPNFLTYIRLLLAPLVMPILIIKVLPNGSSAGIVLTATVFVFFALTDLLDGFLARLYRVDTAWGRALDPIADKFFVIASLLALFAINRLPFAAVFILIGREILVLGLRQFAAEQGHSIKVSPLGKMKTWMQMFLIFLLLLAPIPLWEWSWWGMLGTCVLWWTCYLSTLSAVEYLKWFIKATRS